MSHCFPGLHTLDLICLNHEDRSLFTANLAWDGRCHCWQPWQLPFAQAGIWCFEMIDTDIYHVLSKHHACCIFCIVHDFGFSVLCTCLHTIVDSVSSTTSVFRHVAPQEIRKVDEGTVSSGLTAGAFFGWARLVRPACLQTPPQERFLRSLDECLDWRCWDCWDQNRSQLQISRVRDDGSLSCKRVGFCLYSWAGTQKQSSPAPDHHSIARFWFCCLGLVIARAFLCLVQSYGGLYFTVSDAPRSLESLKDSCCSLRSPSSNAEQKSQSWPRHALARRNLQCIHRRVFVKDLVVARWQ